MSFNVFLVNQTKIEKCIVNFPFLSRSLASSTWSCGQVTCGLYSRRPGSSHHLCANSPPKRSSPPLIPMGREVMGSQTRTPLPREATSPTTASKATIRVETTVRAAMNSRGHPPPFPTRCDQRNIWGSGRWLVSGRYVFGDLFRLFYTVRYIVAMPKFSRSQCSKYAVLPLLYFNL